MMSLKLREYRILISLLLLQDPRERFIMTLKKEIKVLKTENQLLREHAHVPTEGKSPRASKKQGTGSLLFLVISINRITIFSGISLEIFFSGIYIFVVSVAIW